MSFLISSAGLMSENFKPRAEGIASFGQRDT